MQSLLSSNKLIFCIPEGVCNVCYDSLYATFNVLATELGVKNIIILVPTARLRELHSFFIDSPLKDRLYGISTKDLGFTIQGAYLPYFFIMDKSMVCRNLFLPQKYEQGMTDFYLNTVKERFFSQNVRNSG